MLSDDVFRERLETALLGLEAWASESQPLADIDIKATARFWSMAVAPYARGACPFQLVIDKGQRFSLQVAGEVYEKKPIDGFDFFLQLARGIAGGRIDQIETLSAVTGSLIAIETHVGLGDGWTWVGERRVGARPSRKVETPTERRVTTFLPYAR